jgi:uncharacterized protein (TIGR02996 family)
MDHSGRTAGLARRIVANPDDASAWFAYAGDLADNGHEREALVVRMYWPALRDTLATGQSFDAIMRKPTGAAGTATGLRRFRPPTAALSSCGARPRQLPTT